MHKALQALLGLTMLAFAAGTQAASVDLGEVGVGDLVGGSLFFDDGTVIEDEWSFTVTLPQGRDWAFTAISVDANDLDPVFLISDFSVTSPDIAFEFDEADNAFSFTGVLSPGTYTFDVAGLTAGTLGGQYEVLVGVIPLPLPIYMLGASLFALAAVGRRRA